MGNHSQMNGARPFYWSVQVDHFPRALEESLVHWLFSRGCLGTREDVAFKQPDLRYEPELISQTLMGLEAYFSPESREEVEPELNRWLEDRGVLIGSRWQEVIAQNWMDGWKKYFKIFKVAGLSIIPAWKFQPGRHKISNSILIDPGMAFGTGTHATTQLAIKLLAILRRRRQMRGASVIDVGAGTGILSVAAERFGAKSVLAVDVDPECLRQSRKHFRLNKARRASVTAKSCEQIKAHYEIVLANIIDGVLLTLKDALWNLVKPGGHIILSGVWFERAEFFLERFCHGIDCEVVKRLDDQEWAAFLLKKRK